MIDHILILLGALLTVFWGIAHLFPTMSVVKGFGEISLDNKRIIIMEWIVEGVALIFIGTLVAGVTLIDSQSIVSRFVDYLSIVTLLLLALISLFTGFRINFLPFRLCPVIFTVSSLLILMGTML